MRFRGVCILAAVLMVASFSVPIFAQTPSPPATPVPSPETPTHPNEEVAALRAQIEIMREYHERIMDTVYWSLAGVVTIVVLIAGYSWFVNFRMSDRERNALKQELSGLLKEEATNNQGAILNTTNQRFEEFKGDLDRRIEQLKTQVKDAATTAAEGVEMQVNALRETVSTIQYDHLELKALLHATREQYGSVLTARLQMLRIAVQDESEYRIQANLREIEKGLQKGGKLTDSERLRLIELFEKLDSRFADDVSTIRQLIPSAKISW